MIRSFAVLASVFALSLPAAAQDLELPALSPMAQVMQTVGITEITVTYSSPAKRDREIFGGLVPYGELWRTGANAATTIEVSDTVSIGGAEVPAGKYAIFTIPGEDSWTVIINKNPDQGGTRNYDEALDQARFEVEPSAAPVDRERLTFLFEDSTDAAASLVLDWAGTQIAMPIAVDTATLTQQGIDAYASSAAGRMARAARHLLENGGDLDLALVLADAAVAANRSWFNLWIKGSIHYERGDNKGALKLAQEAWDLGQQAENFFYEDRVEAALTDWKKKK
jgi:hypothetical protein